MGKAEIVPTHEVQLAMRLHYRRVFDYDPCLDPTFYRTANPSTNYSATPNFNPYLRWQRLNKRDLLAARNPAKLGFGLPRPGGSPQSWPNSGPARMAEPCKPQEGGCHTERLGCSENLGMGLIGLLMAWYGSSRGY